MPPLPSAQLNVYHDVMLKNPDNAFCLAVIGSAGRKQDAEQVTPELWERARENVRKLLSELAVPAILVSGGAALSDHLAVDAFLSGRAVGLRLHLPAPFDRHLKKFGGFGAVAAVANFHHDGFSERAGLSSLSDIAAAMNRRECVIVPGPGGFFERNTTIAGDCDALVALTFASGAATFEPADRGYSHPRSAGIISPGTADTWRKATKVRWKRHIPLMEAVPVQGALL